MCCRASRVVCRLSLSVVVGFDDTMTMMMTRTINDNEDEDLEGMVIFQTPCSKFQARVVMFKVRVVDFDCRVDIVKCATYCILSTVVLLCPTAMA